MQIVESIKKSRSDILVIDPLGHWKAPFEAEIQTEVAKASKLVGQRNYPVIVLYPEGILSKDLKSFLLELKGPGSLSRIVLVGKYNFESVQLFLESTSLFRILEHPSDQELESTIQDASDDFFQAQQKIQLSRLIEEQNQNLESLSLQLEDRVKKRQKYLTKAHQALTEANRQMEALKRAMMAVHRASSIGEMERFLNDALSAALGLSWIRINLNRTMHLNPIMQKEEKLFSIFAVDLVSDKQKLGTMAFARDVDQPFRPKEKDFLQQIADAVIFAIGRMITLRQAEEIKQQWESTFNSITVPLSLVTRDFTLARVNKTFSELAADKEAGFIGQKCYRVLFGRSNPCENCVMGENFRLFSNRGVSQPFSIIDVSSHPQDKIHFVNIYRDISSQIRLEKQMVESAKMAELGTIGSSIAHELNNPIGGMIALLQLIKMDLKGDEPYFEDIDEMEKASQKCKTIVQNLLSFTRSNEKVDEVADANSVLARVVQIMELQSRPLGIPIETELPKSPVQIKGNAHRLSQVFMGLLQALVDQIAAAMKSDVQYREGIMVSSKIKDSHLLIIVKMKSIKEASMGKFDSNEIFMNAKNQTINAQIVAEFDGTLDFFSDGENILAARLTLPRPVFD